jgi:hypothetical protein
VSQRTKALVAAIDAVIMGVFAFSESGGTFGISIPDLVLWGSVVAAAVCAIVVFVDGVALIAWAAIGYVLFGALLTNGSPNWPLVALALALMPLVPRPNGSLALGLLIATVTALIARTVIGLLV